LDIAVEIDDALARLRRCRLRIESEREQRRQRGEEDLGQS
jgi:hypothetical protein